MNLTQIETRPKRDLPSLKFQIRPDTTDIKVIDEVIHRNSYQKRSIDFFIGEGQSWLDLGGNIGTFAVLALSLGAQKVICYEPEPENFELLSLNLRLNDFELGRYQLHQSAVSAEGANEPIELYICRGDYNKYRHSLIKIRGRPTIKVDCVSLDQVRKAYPEINAIKMDIEGAEIEILEKYDNWWGIDKLVFEYSFDVDPSIPRFLNIIEKLKKSFSTVHYTKVKADESEYKYYPRATMVFCLR